MICPVVFFVTSIFCLLDVLSVDVLSVSLGVCVCKVFGQTENDIFFFLFSPCAWSSSFRDAFFSVHFFLMLPQV